MNLSQGGIEIQTVHEFEARVAVAVDGVDGNDIVVDFLQPRSIQISQKSGRQPRQRIETFSSDTVLLLTPASVTMIARRFVVPASRSECAST